MLCLALGLALTLPLSGCEDIADTVRSSKTLHNAARTGTVPLVYREF